MVIINALSAAKQLLVNYINGFFILSIIIKEKKFVDKFVGKYTDLIHLLFRSGSASSFHFYASNKEFISKINTAHSKECRVRNGERGSCTLALARLRTNNGFDWTLSEQWGCTVETMLSCIVSWKGKIEALPLSCSC